MRLIVLGSIALLVLLAAPAVAPLAPTFPTFGAQVVLPSSTGDGEPSIAVSPADGAIFVVSPGSGDVRSQLGAPVRANPDGSITIGFGANAHSHAYRSTDGGASFSRVADTLGASGDSDVAVDAQGRVYVSDLSGNVPVSVSTNDATSFAYATTSAAAGSLDRQWLLASGDGNAWSFVRDGNVERVGISHDRALTWTQHVVVPSDVAWTSNPTSRDGTSFYFAYTSASDATKLRLAASHDGGLTWTSHDAATINGQS